MSAHTAVRPSVWIGCLACYNSGVLNGHWFPAEKAGEVTPEYLYGLPTSHEELWCFDLERFPARTGEIFPLTAAAWGELYVEVGDDRWDELLTWYENCLPALDVHGVPSAEQFNAGALGCCGSFREFVEAEVDHSGMFYGWPEEAVTYFDWDNYERDYRHDYTVVDAPNSCVLVFRSL